MYNQYSASIYGTIMRTVTSPELAEEILQQTMLKAWNKFDSYDESKSSLYTWLATIARNTALDTVRLKGYQARQKTESVDTLVHDKKIDTNASTTIDVTKLMDSLDPKYKQVIDKVYLQGYSQADAAKALEIPVGTVKTRIRKALMQLRGELKNEKNLFLGLILFVIILICLT